MNRPLQGKNEGKRMLIDFKTFVVPKDEDDVFMSSTGEEIPVLLSLICSNKDVDIIELSMNLLTLLEITCLSRC